MAKDSYSYNRYQKELSKKKKQEEKNKRKLDRKNLLTKGNPEQGSGENVAV